MYIRLDKNNVVREIIPDIDPALPGVTIEKRYPSEFVAELMHVDDNTEVAQNLIYDPETGAFVEPPEPEPTPEPEPEPEPVTVWDEMAAAYQQGVNEA